RRVDGRKVDRGEEVRTLPLLSQVGVYPSAMSRSDAMGVTTILQLLVRGINTGAISRSCTNRRVQAARFETKCADFKAGGQRYRRTDRARENRRSVRNALPACRSGPLQTRHADETRAARSAATVGARRPDRDRPRDWAPDRCSPERRRTAW